MTNHFSQIRHNLILTLVTLKFWLVLAKQNFIHFFFFRIPGYKEARLVNGRHDIAFVEFESADQAKVAKGQLNGYEISPSHPMVITYAKK